MKQACVNPTFDEMLDALSALQRRTLLVALLEHNPQDDTPVVVEDSERDADDVERFIKMQHIHLAKLESYGFVEWDERSHEVAKGPNFDEIRPLLELLDSHDDELPTGWL